jgi:hypothetical protein
MDAYEYKIVEVDGNPITAAQQLNDYAYSGWRVVAWRSEKYVVLERKKEQASAA